MMGVALHYTEKVDIGHAYLLLMVLAPDGGVHAKSNRLRAQLLTAPIFSRPLPAGTPLSVSSTPMHAAV
jgi:hypothetical protein